jgi:hypothetical protein
MSNFNPGDVVVCINDGLDSRSTYQRIDRGWLKAGRHYRVSRAKVVRSVPAVQLAGDPNSLAYPHGYWASDRFRKIDKADEEFTALIKRKAPLKERVA